MYSQLNLFLDVHVYIWIQKKTAPKVHLGHDYYARAK